MRYICAILLLLAAATVHAQEPAFTVQPGFIVVTPTPVPKPAPMWNKCANGWYQSSLSGHYDHPFWGHKDKDFNWSAWFPTSEDMAECEAFMKEQGHTYEMQNQHFIGHMNSSAWQLKQKTKYSGVMQQTYSMPNAFQYTPTQWNMGGSYMRPMMKMGRGSGGC